MISAADSMGWAFKQVVRVSSELRLWVASLAAHQGRRRVLFLVSGKLEGSSLLRGQYVAEALRRLGWHAAVVPTNINRAGRARIVRRFRPDLLIFQQCRHPLNDGEMSFGVPYILDSDDADFYLQIPGIAERLERTSRGARGVIVGSRYLRDYYRKFNSNIAIIWTGTPISATPWPSHAMREIDGAPILAWAQAKPLDFVREFEFVLDVVSRLRTAGARFRLRFYGVDTDAERDALAKRIPDDDLEFRPTLEYDSFLASLREVAIGLCPLVADTPFRRGRSFGKILGYLDAGAPVIASDAADHGLFFRPGTGIVSNEPEVWAREIHELLRNPEARDRMAASAGDLLRDRLSIEVVARLTDDFLRRALSLNDSVDSSERAPPATGSAAGESRNV